MPNRGSVEDGAIGPGRNRRSPRPPGCPAAIVAVFASFILSNSQDMKQLGVGLATAILIDATVVRVVLLPASMKLLGSRNWYLPRPLARLSRSELGATPAGASS